MPPPKEIMGVTLPSTPPEDEPPMKRPRAQVQRSQTPTLNDWPVPSGKPPESRQDSPPGGIKIQRDAKGTLSITMPQVALVAVLGTLGGIFGTKAISKDDDGDRAELLAELRLVREEVKAIRADVREVRKEQVSARDDDKAIVAYVSNSVTPIVASLRKLGVKLEFDGRDLARDVEFHPAPLQGSNAPPIQPKAVLPERPSL